jgi:ribosome-binding ATPase YchF (GTP1/OBG family)
MLRAGIVGLPNVGKSTLFNAVTRTRKAQAANYPFCTIEPNTASSPCPTSASMCSPPSRNRRKSSPPSSSSSTSPAWSRARAQGEGLGNQFLTHIREVDAIIQVVRCFEDDDIHHVSGSVDPVRDIEVITTELVLADLAAVQKRKDGSKAARGGDKQAKAENGLIEKARCRTSIPASRPSARRSPPRKQNRARLFPAHLEAGFFLLTASRPSSPATSPKRNWPIPMRIPTSRLRARLREDPSQHRGRGHLRADRVDLVDLSEDEQKEYLESLGVKESGVGALIRAAYHLLGLRTYFTTGEKETRAWTIHAGDKAPAAAGVIHSDFERGFIAAECTAYDELVKLGSFAKAREAGRLRIEGKEYVVQDGDVLEFRFNVYALPDGGEGG